MRTKNVKKGSAMEFELDDYFRFASGADSLPVVISTRVEIAALIEAYKKTGKVFINGEPVYATTSFEELDRIFSRSNQSLVGQLKKMDLKSETGPAFDKNRIIDFFGSNLPYFEFGIRIGLLFYIYKCFLKEFHEEKVFINLCRYFDKKFNCLLLKAVLTSIMKSYKKDFSQFTKEEILRLINYDGKIVEKSDIWIEL
jgi:hypothetical protein